MSKTNMNQEAASRIQSHADRTQTNQDWKARAQSSAARNDAADAESTTRPEPWLAGGQHRGGNGK